jgi:hypothetical protein
MPAANIGVTDKEYPVLLVENDAPHPERQRMPIDEVAQAAKESCGWRDAHEGPKLTPFRPVCLVRPEKRNPG